MPYPTFGNRHPQAIGATGQDRTQPLLKQKAEPLSKACTFSWLDSCTRSFATADSFCHTCCPQGARTLIPVVRMKEVTRGKHSPARRCRQRRGCLCPVT